MTRDLPQRISDAILSVVSLPDNEALPLHSPVFDELDEQYIKSCIKSTYVSSVGPFVDEFETSVAAYTGSTFAVAVSSGTAGLHAALLIAGVKPLDEVIVPPLTSQYLNLTKNSSLGIAVGYADLVHGFGGISLNQTGQAIECMLIVMATYLTISLIISLFMNIYNRSIQFKEK